jgi:hypothetical protein
MPMPKPRKDETEQEFISRFMGDPVMVKDYPDQKQRSAIAYKEWNDRNKKKESMSEDLWADDSVTRNSI